MTQIMDRLFATGHSFDLVTQFIQQTHGDFSLLMKVVYDQNRFASSHIRIGRYIFLTVMFNSLFCCGEVNREGASLARFTLHIDIPFMILDGSPDNGQSQSCSASAHDFFCIERFENLSDVGAGDALPVVANGQGNVIAFRDFDIAGMGFVKATVTGGDADFSSVGNCFSGIGDEIHHRFSQRNRQSFHIE